jgi:glutamate dehydrogenase
MQKHIKKIVEFSQKKKQSKAFISFVSNFYSQNQDRDFINHSIEDLYKLALQSFEFVKNKKGSKSKIQITKNETHSVIDIVNDDKSFLVDSIVSLIESNGFDIQNIIHPIYHIVRDKNGDLVEISDENAENDNKESVIQVHIVGFLGENEASDLNSKLERILETVAVVVDDWHKIVKETTKIAKDLSGKIQDKKEAKEIEEFITWIVEKGFIFLGFKEFLYKKNKSNFELEPIEKSSLGVFRSKYDEFRPKVANSSHDEIDFSVKSPFIVEILKSSYKSRIHRLANAERIRIQKFDDKGNAIGEYRLIGLFTSAAYYQSSSSIPLIRDKITRVIKKLNFSKGSHNYKDLISVLEDYPRDELFQIEDAELARIASGIVMICGRHKIKFFARKDKFGRFVSCLVFMPKDRSNSEFREKVRAYIAKRYHGRIADNFVQITESSLVRLHVIIELEDKNIALQEAEIEKEIIELSKPWKESLKEAVYEKFEGGLAKSLFKKYRNSFSVSYINRFDARRAAIDISRIEMASSQNKVIFNIYKSSDVDENLVELKVYSPQSEIYLSQMMPILESFGLNVIHEHTYICDDNSSKIWIHYFKINLGEKHKFDEDLKSRFEEAIDLAWTGVLSVGSLNRLIIYSGLNWKEIFMIRAYAKYVYQAGFRHDQEYVSNILVKHENLTKLLVELFDKKFNTAINLSFKKRLELVDEIVQKIKSELNKVSDVSHDETIRKFFAVINATLRTNYYQKSENGCFKGYMSFKLDSKNIPDLPLPVPFAEIFVFSNHMAGIHLRGGKVARGGLRWSDRHEDFRTEVLGLVKAQMTKNAVIVPVGSKGGFVVNKDLTGLSRDEFMKEGILAYQTFLRGLLDLTDNVIASKIIHPKDTILHDESDPYLVVAADKGTATFSDIANAISDEYSFWLGDAFASGGSVGYDHKKMGITAKGAWVSVMRHFAEMGIDTQKQDFTCAGIGDLAGDVFGNGMLLSPHIKLVAAFNHMHIFLDPNPDVKKTFAERQRMFNLPRSSWMDYDKTKISKGGGIFERSAKSIKISKEIKEVLMIEEDEITPDELIEAILKAPVDLLWNGGIGTYVKASSESHADVGDRANDALRIDGVDLRCKVVGEGGNLGFTQKGRIEYAMNGGRINTDAMDNSAGVDCSDHEVNIKIALASAMLSGKITLPQRNKVLESMTADVSALVLNDNYLQTQAVTIAQNQGISSIGVYGQFLKHLEKKGILNREMEFLPSSKELQKRQVEKIGLTRPELCVMLSYAKMEIYQEILSSKLVDDKYFEAELMAYFPVEMQKNFAEEIKNHQLRREIIATQITNFIVNRGGIAFLNQICQESGFKIAEAAKCFIIACESFGLREIWLNIENQSIHVNYRVKAQMFSAVNKLLERSVLWLLRRHLSGDLTSVIQRFRKIANDLYSILTDAMAQDSKESYEKKYEAYRLNNVENVLAKKIAALDPISSAFDIAEISAKSKFDLSVIAKIYFEVGTRFGLKWLRNTLSEISCDGYWDRLSNKTIIEDFYTYQARIAKQIVDENCDKKSCGLDSVEDWIKSEGFLVERYDNFINDLRISTSFDVSMFVVALNRLKPLIK